MNDYNQQYQNSLSDLIKSQESVQRGPKAGGGYSDNLNNNRFSDRKDYPVKKTTFSKIKYV